MYNVVAIVDCTAMGLEFAKRHFKHFYQKKRCIGVIDMLIK